MGKGKVVLAYSGGLDTSICIPLLRERYQFDEVITVVADVGQPEAEIAAASEKGRNLADQHHTLDLRDAFIEGYIFPSIKANVSYEGYPAGTSLARPLIAEAIAALAQREGAKFVAHGCTGKGNDQLRFDFAIRSAGLEVIAPIREGNLTRDWEIEYAQSHGIPCQVVKSNPYSIDENCWNRSIEGGRLEDPAFHPPEEIYRWTVDPTRAPDAPEVIAVSFQRGVPVALNGKQMTGIDLVQEANRIAGSHGVGRNDMIEDRILGLKAREIYEHPAATLLIAAHRDLEQLVLTRAELQFKRMVDDRWSELAYMGLVREPLFDALNAFIDTTSERVTGTVDMKLFKGSCMPVGRSSENALYSASLVSFDSAALDQCTAEGFSKYYGLQAQMWQRIKEQRR